MTIAIIGAGMAGLACAEALVRDGRVVVLFDKGRQPGGRMSTRTMATPVGVAAFDYGAQYVTARDPAFRERMARWQAAGLVARWPAAGDEAWVGMPGMSTPLDAMARPLDVRWSAHVRALERKAEGWRVRGDGFAEDMIETVVVAVPAEQVGALAAAHVPELARAAAAAPSRPCWTLAACFAAALPIQADVLEGEGALGWAARDSAKPGRDGPETWVIQADPDWSLAHLEETREAVTAALLEALAERAGNPLPAPVATHTHRWRYARSGRGEASCHWDAAERIGLCGDWCIGPRVEAAWLSGTALAAAIRGSLRPGALPNLAIPR